MLRLPALFCALSLLVVPASHRDAQAECPEPESPLELSDVISEVATWEPAPLDSRVSVGRDDHGRVVVVKSLFNSVAYLLDARGRHVAAVDSIGNRRYGVFEDAESVRELSACFFPANGVRFEGLWRYDTSGFQYLSALLPGSADLQSVATKLGVTPSVLADLKPPLIEVEEAESTWSTHVYNSLGGVQIQSTETTTTTTTRFQGRSFSVTQFLDGDKWNAIDSLGVSRSWRSDADGQPIYVADSYGVVLATQFDELGRVASVTLGDRVEARYSYSGQSTLWHTKTLVDLWGETELLVIANPHESNGSALSGPPRLASPSFGVAELRLAMVGPQVTWHQVYDRPLTVAYSGSMPYALLSTAAEGDVLYTVRYSLPGASERVDYSAEAVVLHVDTGERDRSVVLTIPRYYAEGKQRVQEEEHRTDAHDCDRPGAESKVIISLCGPDCICIYHQGGNSSAKAFFGWLEVVCPPDDPPGVALHPPAGVGCI